jgi:hypothetical protein
MRSHIFSKCCMSPIRMGNICSACNQQAELVIEYSDPDSGEQYMDFSYVLRAKPLPVVTSITKANDRFTVNYHTEDGSVQSTDVMYADILTWGHKYGHWSKVFVKHYLDSVNDEEYTQIWSWYPYRKVADEGSCSHINAQRQSDFINSVNAQTMGQYLCQLQRQVAV